MSEIYTSVVSYRLLEGREYKEATVRFIDKGIRSIAEFFSADPGFINFHLYRSYRTDSDIIFWYSSRDPDLMILAKDRVQSIMRQFASPAYSSISIYDESPYNAMNKKLEDSLKLPPLRYFVAYPMSKTPDWYLLDFDTRKDIMHEHVKMALNHPDEKGIRSYTTYSFGIGDQEFVVLYEVPDIAAWSRVTEKLREARARKWIVKETPILLGRLVDAAEFTGFIF
ncbi:chlorite dismutase family protein [Thermoplasma sp.]|uniref:chlorite dismutase family protein n=1 Tax=Thermoplasma sp. TaxID=1973142 RepID=UPI00127DC970|nr:chlorite dismutase family protein [Thermoplasma sp.]KAA8923412.1 MAG: chlorite dismutase family protein [Thermoplasma sp.]